MNVKIADLMSELVMVAESWRTINHVRALMERNSISAVPVVDEDGSPVGIVTATDLIPDLDGNKEISTIMTPGVTAIPQYNDISAAARVMRKNRIHHVVVTHEKKVVGIISSFDLLQLVEDRRFVPKQGPTTSKKKAKSSG